MVLLSFLLFAATPSYAFRVLLDPGHGGHDHGAINSQITESAITLSVANKVASALGQKSDFQVSLTRSKDVFLSLSERADIANRGTDLFLSIHANASSDPKARGNELYFQNQLPPDEESLFLASRENQSDKAAVRSVQFPRQRKHLNSDVRAILEDLERGHRLRLSGLFAEELHRGWSGEMVHRQRSIRQAPFFVISNVTVPAALIEIGYLTNPNEAKQLANPSYQQQIARGIAEAIIRFKEVMDNKARPNLN